MTFQDWFYISGIGGVVLWAIVYVIERYYSISKERLQKRLWDTCINRIEHGTTNININPTIHEVEKSTPVIPPVTN